MLFDDEIPNSSERYNKRVLTGKQINNLIANCIDCKALNTQIENFNMDAKKKPKEINKMLQLNNKFKKRLEGAGLKITGVYPKANLAEIVEIGDHPWFVAVQFHPELQSRPLHPHPLFRDFVKAAAARLAEQEKLF